MFQKLLRVYCYLFTIAASVAYLALGLIAKISGTELSLDNMPWKGAVLADWLLGLAALGIIGVISAMTGGKLRFLLIVFCAAVVFVTVKGNFLSTHSFSGADDFERVVALSAGSVVALLASLLQLKRPAPKV